MKLFNLSKIIFLITVSVHLTYKSPKKQIFDSENMLEDLCIGIFVIFIISCGIYNLTRRLSTITDLPEDKLNYIFYGIATSVGDGDGFHIYHVPLFRSANYNARSKMLPIRMAGIDAPEVRGYGKPAQPKSREAKQYLAHMILKKTVRVRVLNIDMYNRILAIVYVRKCYIFWENVNFGNARRGISMCVR